MDIKLKLIIAAFFLTGCSAEYKALKEIEKQHYLNYKRPAETAKDFAKLFPVQDKVLPGKIDTLITHDTTSLTVPCPPAKNGEPVYVKVPSVTTRTVTITKSDTVLRRDVSNEAILTAQGRVLRDSLIIERTQHKVASKQRNNWMFGTFGLAAAFIGLLAWKWKSIF